MAGLKRANTIEIKRLQAARTRALSALAKMKEPESMPKGVASSQSLTQFRRGADRPWLAGGAPDSQAPPMARNARGAEAELAGHLSLKI